MRYAEICLIVITLLFIACERPKADFTIKYNKNYTLEKIYFQNNSTEAYSYFWLFGDGDSTENINPVHIYKKADNYKVKLFAYSKDKTRCSVKEYILQIVQPTDILARVIIIGSYNALSECEVKLYKSLNDWIKDENIIAQGISDEDGYVYLRELDTVIYYFRAYKEVESGYYSNYKAGYMSKKPLTGNTVNFFDIFVKYENK